MQDLNDKVTGGILTAAEWNEVPSELQNVIQDTGQTLSSGDLNQLGKGIAEYSINGDFCTDSGAVNAYVLSTVNSKQAAIGYRDGMRLRFRTANANTGAATVNYAGLGVKNIVDKNGDALSAGQILSGGNEIVFDLANDRFVLNNPELIGVKDYIELRAKDVTTLIDGQVITVTNTGIAGDFILRNSVAHGLTDNGGTLIVIDADWYAERVDYGLINIEWFGAVENTDSSLAIRAAVAAGPSFAPNKRYIYDGATISTDNVMIVGEKMPQLKTGLTGLENGSIFEGSLVFTGNNVWLENFGVDLGTDTSAAIGDGVSATAQTLDGGGHLHIDKVISLCKNPSDAFHAFVLQSYQKFTGGIIHGINSLFSCVIKCKNIQLDKVYCDNSNSRGLYLKSDNTFGACDIVNIDEVIVNGRGNTSQGFYLQSDGAQITKCNIGKMTIIDCAEPFALNNSASGIGINEVNIGDLIIDDATGDAFSLIAPFGFVYDCNVNNLSIINCDAKAIATSGLINHLNVNNAFISYRAGTPDAVMLDGVDIVASVLRTNFNNITITRAYGADEVNIGYINYENLPTNNTLGNHVAKVRGVGAPTPGYLQVNNAGGSFTVTPAVNRRDRAYAVVTDMTANGTITNIDNEPYSGQYYEIGSILTIINNSQLYTLTINHNPGASGNVRNNGSVNKVLGPEDTIAYALSPNADDVANGPYWVQLTRN